MTWEIDRTGLHSFIDEQLDVIASKPLPMDTVDFLIATDAPDDILTAAYGAWVAAGLSVLVGETIREEPERFLIETD